MLPVGFRMYMFLLKMVLQLNLSRSARAAPSQPLYSPKGHLEVDSTETPFVLEDLASRSCIKIFLSCPRP
jgi:hypothetical protein